VHLDARMETAYGAVIFCAFLLDCASGSGLIVIF
jgi:hypothetical protein